MFFGTAGFLPGGVSKSCVERLRKRAGFLRTGLRLNSDDGDNGAMGGEHKNRRSGSG